MWPIAAENSGGPWYEIIIVVVYSHNWTIWSKAYAQVQIVYSTFALWTRNLEWHWGRDDESKQMVWESLLSTRIVECNLIVRNDTAKSIYSRCIGVIHDGSILRQWLSPRKIASLDLQMIYICEQILSHSGYEIIERWQITIGRTHTTVLNLISCRHRLRNDKQLMIYKPIRF